MATQEFAAKGYKNTHVTTIMRGLGITATVFYGHFASKRRLLAECGQVLMDWRRELDTFEPPGPPRNSPLDIVVRYI